MKRETEQRPEGHDESELIAALEPDQLVTAASKSLPRLQLGVGLRITLWAARLFVLIISLLVVYTFIVALMTVR
jgi:hypothetical protein